MRLFLARRAAQAVVIAFVVVTIVFTLIDLAPGDPYYAALENPAMSPSVVAARRARDGLDQPIAMQYVKFLRNIATGDLGDSFSQRRPVAAALGDALPRTVLLMGVALAVSFLLGVGAGVAQAIRRGRPLDRLLSAIGLFFYSMPDFWLAIVMLLVFARWVPIFPPAGMTNVLMHQAYGPLGRIADVLYHLVLPAMTLALLSAAVIARYQRSALLSVAHEEFVRTARAKGVGERAVLVRHMLRNALLPVITIFGLAFPALFGGAVFVETIFAWPGMGTMTVNAIGARDYPLVVAGALVGSLMVTAGTLLADVLYAVVDPRLREQ